MSLRDEGVGPRSRNRGHRGPAAVVLIATLTVLCAQEPTFSISGEVQGASGAHTIRVALWDEQGFLQKPVTELRLDAGNAARYRFVVQQGRWAISAYEDRNDNGVLDMGLFGPKEPAGFWRPFRAWRKPHFAEIATSVDRDISNANVELR